MFQRTKGSQVFRYIGLLLLLFFATFPVFFLFLSSLKMPREIFKFPPTLIFKPTFLNYHDLLKDWPQFFPALLNSLIVAAGASLLTILITAPAGYALSRHRRKFLSISAFFLLIIRMYPPIVITIPLYPIFSVLGLVDSHFLLILLYSTFEISLSTWLMKTYMDEVPVEIEEAASIDGANTFQIATKIIIPLSIHGIIATIIFVSIFAWKEYTFAYIFTSNKAQTAPIILEQMLTPVTKVSWGPLFAAATIQLFPILILLWMVQTYLIRGISAGSVKG
jgi:multiple sugar transport system permease protein